MCIDDFDDETRQNISLVTVFSIVNSDVCDFIFLCFYGAKNFELLCYEMNMLHK